LLRLTRRYEPPPSPQDELYKIDAAYASELQDQMRQRERASGGRASMHSRFLGKLMPKWTRFGKLSMYLFGIGFIPVIGPIVATLGQWLLVSEQLGLSLLSTYLQARGIDGAAKTAFVEANRWEIIGFAAPFAFANAIPVIGGPIVALAQAASAHLVYRHISPPQDASKQAQSAGEVTSEVRRFETLGANASSMATPVLGYAQDMVKRGYETVMKEQPAFLGKDRAGANTAM
jgi:hypothetical protein